MKEHQQLTEQKDALLFADEIPQKESPELHGYDSSKETFDENLARSTVPSNSATRMKLTS